MMKKVTILLVVVLFASIFAVGQEEKAEVFGGYQYTRMGTGTLNNAINTSLLPETNAGAITAGGNGFNFAVTGFVNKYFGITADISRSAGDISVNLANDGSFKATGRLTTTNFLFGPTVAMRTGKINPYVHALFGISHATLPGKIVATGVATPLDSGTLVDGNSFAMAFGGGLDVKVAKHISVRLGQFDYLRTSHSLTNDAATNFFGLPSAPSDTQNSLRYSTGIVFKF
jgi:opacity protein-like surface antigen